MLFLAILNAKICKQKPKVLGGKDKDVCSYNQMEIPKSPVHTLEFLSRSWSPSQSDFRHIFSSTVRNFKNVQSDLRQKMKSNERMINYILTCHSLGSVTKYVMS